MIIDSLKNKQMNGELVKIKLSNGYVYEGLITCIFNPNNKGQTLIYLLDKKHIKNYDPHHHKSCLVTFLDNEVISLMESKSNFFNKINTGKSRNSNPLTLADQSSCIHSGSPSSLNQKIKRGGKRNGRK